MVVATFDISYSVVPYSYQRNQLVTITPTTRSVLVNSFSADILPALPDGLTFNINTAVISGTPTIVSTTTTYTVNVITDPPTGPHVPTFTLTIVGINYSPSAYSLFNKVPILPITPSSVGGPFTYAINPALSPGLIFSTSTGNISGTPSAANALASYTVTANSLYTAPLSLTVADISYASVASYLFLKDISINSITPTVFANLTGATYSIAPPLPNGLGIDNSGTIVGTPRDASAQNTSVLTVTTASNYSKQFSFPMTVADISYAPAASYVYLKDISINSITPTVFANLTGATYSFVPPLPAGLNIDSSGTILGTPRDASAQKVSVLRVSTANSSIAKQFSFPMTVADISYAIAKSYAFLADISINPIKPTVFANLTAGSYSVNSNLPIGLSIDNSGTIAGTPYRISFPTTYDLLFTTQDSSRSKQFSFPMAVNDISYGTYDFLSNIPVNKTPLFSYIVDASLSAISASLPYDFSLNLSTGLIFGTPTATAVKTTYNFIRISIPNTTYTKIVPFTFTVIDISYAHTNYEFITDISINTITPVLTNTNLNGISMNFSPSLPNNLLLDSSGNISGTPTSTSAINYTLQINNISQPGYTKTIDFSFNVVDISYAYTSYEFIAGVDISAVSPLSYNTLQDASLNFDGAFPAGLRIDPSGNLKGTPRTKTPGQTPIPSNLTLRTNQKYSSYSNYSKTIPFAFNVVDLSYAFTTYEFIAGVDITTLPPLDPTSVKDAVLNFDPPLPSGLQIDASGNLTGTPVDLLMPTTYRLTLTPNNQYSYQSPYSKTIDFSFNVVDISYAYTSYEFIAGVDIYAISPVNYTMLQDASLNFQQGLPAGLRIDASGNITGKPLVATRGILTYPLSIITNSKYPKLYTKSYPFFFNIVDLSYAITTYEFIKGSPVYIAPLDTQSVQDASLNFTPPLTKGLAIDASGNISGTPTGAMDFYPFTLTLSTNPAYNYNNNPSYTKDISFNFGIVDISYPYNAYEFISDISVNILPNDYNALKDASFNFNPPLPSGLTIDGSGNIRGTPSQAAAGTGPYTLTVKPNSKYPQLYSKESITLKIVDISYTYNAYEFIAGVDISAISPVRYDTLLDGSLNGVLPLGLSLDASGRIYGQPVAKTPGSNPYPYKLTLKPNSQYPQLYSKNIFLYLNVVDLSYAHTTYEFIAGKPIYTISPLDQTSIKDASLNITPALPDGLTINKQTGNITGTPTTTLTPTFYTFRLQTLSHTNSSGYTYNNDVSYNKTITFQLNVIDISYAHTVYEFLVGQPIYTILPNLQTSIQDASFTYILPPGLNFNASTGSIYGTPLAPSIGMKPYPLTLKTNSQYNSYSSYNKTIDFSFNVVDISYAYNAYEFFVAMPVSVAPVNPGSVQDASLSFNGVFPVGLTMDSAGNLTGTPTTTQFLTNNTKLTIRTNSAYNYGTSGYSKDISLNFGIADISYADTTFVFLVDIAISDIIPLQYFILPGINITFDSALPDGLIFDIFNGIISGTPLTSSHKPNYVLTATTLSNSIKQITFTIDVADISYDGSPYVYVQNVSTLYLPLLYRGEILTPSSYDISYFNTISLDKTLPTNLVIDLSTGIIQGTPLFPSVAQNYTLTATTTTGYTKIITFNIQVEGFHYVQDAYTYNMYESVKIMIDQNIGYGNSVYSNFTVTPDLPRGLILNSDTGLITGMSKFTKDKETYFITGVSDPVISVPITIRIINPHECKWRCPPLIIIPRPFGTANVQAMRYSTLVRTGLGQSRLIASSNSNINRTYEEPPRNKF